MRPTLPLLLAASFALAQKPEPPDAAPRTRMEQGRLIYQLGETVFAFRLSKGPWTQASDGLYLDGRRLVMIATARSVRYEDAIEAQSRAIASLLREIDAACPTPGACRLNPEAWPRFERFAWLNPAAGECRLLLRLPASRVSVARKGPRDFTPALAARLRAARRTLRSAP